MIRNFLKKAVNDTLSAFNYRIVRDNPRHVSGRNLFEDLGRIVGSNSPICIDVGANVGQTIDALLITFRNPIVHSFEPSESTFRVLEERGYGSRVRLHHCALGAEKLEREFINYEKSVLSSFLPLDKSNENRFRNVVERGRETVAVETLDSFLTVNEISNVDILKIDTQGFDLDVLKGARKSLKNGAVRYVLVEMNFVRMYEGQSSAEDIFTELSAAGFYLIDYYEKVRQQRTIAWCTALFGRR